MKLTERLAALAGGPSSTVILPHGDGLASLRWCAPDEDLGVMFPDLEDVADELVAYLPLALAEHGSAGLRCLFVQRAAPHSVWLYRDGLRELYPSLDAFSAALCAGGEEPPLVRLERVASQVGALLDKGAFTEAAEALRSVLPSAPPSAPPTPEGLGPEHQRLLRALFTDLGVAEHGRGDDRAAEAAYRVAAGLGSRAAAENLVTLAIDGARWEDAQARLCELRTWYHDPAALGALRVREVHVLAVLRDAAAAGELGSTHASFLRELAHKDRTAAEALRASFVSGLEALPVDGDAAAIVRRAAEPVRAPLPAPAALSQGDLATALRLIASGKRAQLRSLLQRLPALADEASVVAAIRALPGGPVREQLLDDLAFAARGLG